MADPHSIDDSELLDAEDTVTANKADSPSFLSLLLLNVLVTTALLLAVAYGWPQIHAHILPHLPGWQPTPVPAGISDASGSGTLSKRLDDLESRVSQMQKTVTETQLRLKEFESEPAAESAQINQDLHQRLGVLETTLERLQSGDTAKGDILSLQQELLTAERTLHQQLEQFANMGKMDFRVFIAFQELQALALEGKDYTSALQKMQALGADNLALQEALSALQPFATFGRPGSATLQQEFTQLLSQLQRAKLPQDDSFTGKIKHNLSQFVTIRRVHHEGDSPEAHLNRAESAVKSGNFEMAMAEIKALPENTRQDFESWLQRATAYQTIPSLLNAVEMQLAEQMFAGTGNPQ